MRCAHRADAVEARLQVRLPRSFGYNNGPRCSPLLTADRCYTFGAEGVLLCLDLATGKLVWRRDTQTDFAVPEAFFGVGSSPVLEDGLLFVQVGGQPNSGVVAFDADDRQNGLGKRRREDVERRADDRLAGRAARRVES